jgi:hypothetical protein
MDAMLKQAIEWRLRTPCGQEYAELGMIFYFTAGPTNPGLRGYSPV